jgi:putative membrane protein
MAAINWGIVLNSVIFALLGVVIYGVVFYLLDHLTPYHLWREINEKQNSALAILVGALAIGIAIIVAAAIHS